MYHLCIVSVDMSVTSVTLPTYEAAHIAFTRACDKYGTLYAHFAEVMVDGTIQRANSYNDVGH